MIIYHASPRCLVAAVTLLGVTGTTALAQPPAAWRFTAPDAAAAWFATLEQVHLAGPGAFPYYRGTGAPDSPLARNLAASPQYEILHFAPLYYPSATRQALVRAARDAATPAAPPGAPRAALLVGALSGALRSPSLRAPLAALADAVERSRPAIVPAEALERWQHAWDDRFATALAPFLQAERLDAGMVIVAAALGPEGRLFAGRPADRSDNVVAVGTSDDDSSPDAPVLAFIRELCFPLVSRSADQSPALRAPAAESARRTSIAAVRCGAELLDLLAPAEASGYRAHWQHAADRDERTPFDSLFSPDPLLAPRIHTALLRIAAQR